MIWRNSRKFYACKLHKFRKQPVSKAATPVFLCTSTDALQKNMGLMHLLAQGYAEHAVSNCFLLFFTISLKKWNAGEC
jgi:hypothetical protein